MPRSCQRRCQGLLSGLAALLLGATTCDAMLVAQHSGSTNPLTEGWSAGGAQIGVTAGPIIDSGVAAWSVDDNSAAEGSILLYSTAVTPADALLGSTNGWELTTRLRIASDEALGFDGSPFVSYRDGSTGWEMSFSLNGSGDSVVRLYTGATTGPTFTIAGNADYNEYSLRFDPDEGSADLFVNGTEVISNYTGFTDLSQAVLWGAGRSPDLGQGNFASVTLVAAVPEPMVLLPLTALVVARSCCGRRRR